MKKITLDEFIKFEYENRLFNVSVDSVYYWIYIRNSIYKDLYDLGYGIGKKKKINYIPKEKRKISIKILYERWIKYNILFAKHRDILIFSSERKYRFDKFYEDIFTHLLDKELKISHYVIDKNFQEEIYLPQDSNNIKMHDINLYQAIFSIKPQKRMVTKEKFDKDIIEPLEKYFKVTIDTIIKKEWLSILNSYLLWHDLYASYYRFILNKIRPKLILLVCSYAFSNQVLCEVAKEKNIPTIELQHGMSGNLEIPYDFYKKMRLRAFPDYFFAFGEYDKYNTRWPIANSRVIPVGFPYYEKRVNEIINVSKHNKVKIILALSSMQENLLKEMISLSRLLNPDEYKIIYKLHPLELKDTNISALVKGTGIELAQDIKKDVYFYFEKADWVIGIGTTALYEAVSLRLNIAILDCGKSDNSFDILCESGRAVKVKDAYEFSQVLQLGKCNYNCKKNIFYEKNSLSRMKKAILFILSQQKRIKENKMRVLTLDKQRGEKE